MTVGEGQAIAFLVVAAVLLLLSALALLSIGTVRLDSFLGIFRDGLPIGTEAPWWRLPDTRGELRATPSLDSWQLLVFANHAIREFPSLVDGIRRLANDTGLEVLFLPRTNPAVLEELGRVTDLDVPIVAVDEDLYRLFNVRVTPFFIFIDPRGVVRSVGLVNYEDELLDMWRLAQAPLSVEGGARLDANQGVTSS